ncbi:hypothetical protein, partial [uncultured Thalassospira sp.]|uniref:hypothetical protein n=1 Tax=uncultured Thalassospira sp. TaxID=404382 RepID=UPI0032B25069
TGKPDAAEPAASAPVIWKNTLLCKRATFGSPFFASRSTNKRICILMARLLAHQQTKALILYVWIVVLHVKDDANGVGFVYKILRTSAVPCTSARNNLLFLMDKSQNLFYLDINLT